MLIEKYTAESVYLLQQPAILDRLSEVGSRVVSDPLIPLPPSWSE
jgi:hypothetical protein